jgi:hypothetical protein
MTVIPQRNATPNSCQQQKMRNHFDCFFLVETSEGNLCNGDAGAFRAKGKPRREQGEGTK